MAPIEAPRQYDTIDGVLAPSQTLTLFDHAAIRTALSQMREEGRLHHALLFEGEKGIGKATLAFHLAWNVVSDHQGALVAPDPQSQNYRQMVQGSHPQILHLSRPLDSKSERFRSMITVEEIRDVTRLLTQTSSDGGWRVVMIDSADDMNRNAANALLKTLEEPPAKVLFILISHYAGRLLPTIRSRCQTLSFHPLNRDNLVKALKNALESPFDSSLNDSAFILDRAEGSVRKAALLLNYGGLEIIRAVDAILSEPIASPEKIQALAQTLSGRDATIQLQQFYDDSLMRIADQAAQSAKQGKSNRAEFWAQFWQDKARDIADAEAYNLDKKQFIITLLHHLHDAFYRNTNN